MKVAIVNQPLDGILPPTQNSIGIWTYEVARRLADRAEVTVYGRYFRFVQDRGEGRIFEDHGVSYRYFHAGPNRVWAKLSQWSAWVLSPTKPLYASPLYYFEYSVQVAIDLRRSQPDIIHVHNFTGFLPIIRLLNPRATLVLHMNCEWLSQLDAGLMSRRMKQTNAVFGSSDHITHLIQRRFPSLASRCNTVYNGVDVEAFDGASNDAAPQNSAVHPSILFVGRVSPEKGLHDLIDAIGSVLDEHPTTRLDIVGPIGSLPLDYIIGVSDDDLVKGLDRFYDRDYYQTLLDKIPAQHASNIVFHGSKSQADVIEYTRSATLLVNPSYSESFGMSLVEAMACGVPVVATRVGGMKEIVVDGSTGRLVAPASPLELADAINTILDDEALRIAMGTAGRARVLDYFSWDRVSERVFELYTDLARHRSSPTGSATVGSQ